MKIRIFTVISLLFCFPICYAISTDLSGNWTGNLINSDGSNYPVNYHFSLNSNQITGTATSTIGTFTIDSGKLDSGNLFHFQVTVNGVNILHRGKFYVDSIGMDINLNGALAHCTLLRNSNQ